MLPKSTAVLVQAAASLLEDRRIVKHSQNDAVAVAIDSVMRTAPVHVKMLSRFFVDPDDERVIIRVTPQTKRLVYEHAKNFGVSAKALINSVMVVFLRASLAAFWQNNRSDLQHIRASFPDFLFAKKREILDVPKAQEPKLRKRRLNKKREELAMRHHNYMDTFKGYMLQYGGIDSYCNKNLTLSIHTHPIEGNINRTTPDDKPIGPDNPSGKYWVRIWKRGRGYNITIHGIEESNPDDSPQLAIGAVYRLYEIYRNIDWSKISIIIKD